MQDLASLPGQKALIFLPIPAFIWMRTRILPGMHHVSTRGWGYAVIPRTIHKTGLKKVSHGLDFPVLLVSLFDRHNLVNPYHVGIDVVKQGIFQ